MNVSLNLQNFIHNQTTVLNIREKEGGKLTSFTAIIKNYLSQKHNFKPCLIKCKFMK